MMKPDAVEPHHAQTDRDHRTLRTGLALAVLAAVMSGIAVFVGAYGVREFPSAAVYTTLRNTIVALMLLAFCFRPAQIRELQRTSPRQRLGLALLGLVGGSIPFALFFEGLSQVGPGTGAFLQKTLFLWVAVLAVVFLRERLGLGQMLALGLLLAAQFLLGGPGALTLGPGVLMVLTATLLWSLEVVLAKRLFGGGAGSQLAATARMTVGAIILLAYLAISGRIGVLTELSAVQWAWAIGPSVLLCGYVVTWYAALHRAPATAVTCVLTLGAPITAVLTVIAAGGWPRPSELLGYAGMLLAIVLVIGLTSRQATLTQKSLNAIAPGGS